MQPKKKKKVATIVSSLWTRCSIKNVYANVRIDVTPTPSVRIRSHFNGFPKHDASFQLGKCESYACFLFFSEC